jgi:O-antigen/teichoic acid export membrane protein
VNSQIKLSIATKAFVAGINFLLIIISARYLGANGRGEISFFITVLATTQLFAEIINGPTIVYLSTRLSIRKKIIISFGWAILISLISYFIFALYEFKDSFLLAISSLQFSLSMICLMILQGNNKIKTYNLLLLLQSFLLLGLFLLLILTIERDYHYFIYAFLISWNIPFIIGLFNILKTIKKDHLFKESYKETFTKMFQKGIESQTGNIISFLNYRLIFYVLAFQNSDKFALGIVSTGFAIVESILMIGNGLGTIQYPYISNSHNITEAKKITIEYVAISFWLSIICLIIINCIPAQCYSFIFGKDFTEIKILVLILSPGILFLNIQNTLSFYFNGLGLYLINTFGSSIGLVSFIALSIIGYKYGIIGLCTAVSISYIILFIYMLYRFNKHSNTFIIEIIKCLAHPKKLLIGIIKKNDN